MSNRRAANSAAASGRGCRPGLCAPLLALLVIAWTGACGEARADTIVLKSGEVIEGSIIDATRNTVIVQRVIGGMRQMPIRDIAEMRIELAQGQRISGQLLSWTDGVYQVRSGGEVMRIAAGDILSREAVEEAMAQRTRGLPPRPAGPQTMRMAAAPVTSAPADTAADGAAPAREQMAAQRPEDEAQSPAAGEQQSAAAADEEPSPAAGEQQSVAAVDEKQSPATDAQENLVAVKASVDPAEPGADQMVFRIELSRPAEQTVVLIYGTVEGTAKAGEDFEPKQGIVTLAPGTESAEVHVPLLESAAKGEKRFELFLTADPKVAEIVDRRVVATINGAD